MDKRVDFFTDNKNFLEDVLNSIKNAKKSIYIETYRYKNDKFGKSIKKALYEKAKEGVKIKLIIDSWGSNVGYRFFKKLKKVGVKIRFFKEFMEYLLSFSNYHKRNHRKMIIIDNEISYIGSSNIKYKPWRESNIKIKDEILASKLKEIFIQDFRNYKGFIGYVKVKRKYVKPIKEENFEIIRDVPSSIKHKTSLSKYYSLIKSAKEEVIIETPYFLPPRKLRRALIGAARRKVKVKIILPKNSDVKIVDILRRRYLKKLVKYKNIELYLYKKPLHSKILTIDNKKVVIGSVNLDYRSFYLQYELSIILNNQSLIRKIKKDSKKVIKNSTKVTKRSLKKTNFVHRIALPILRGLEPLF